MGADVVALTVELGRVMEGEEYLQQLAIAELVSVEGNADRLGMAGIAAADLLVGRIDGLPAGIAAFDRLHSDDIEEHRLGAPETSACEHRHFIGHLLSPPAKEENRNSCAIVEEA